VQTDTVALPAGLNDYFLFSPLRTEKHVEGSSPSLVTMPPGFDRPTAGALDIREAYSGVAFGDRVAFLENDTGAEPRTVSRVLPLAVDAMSVRGTLASLVSTRGGEVQVVTVPSGDEVWQDSFKNWIDCLHYAVPLSETRVLLAGHDGSGVVVQDLDRSSGDWTSRGANTHPAIHALQAATTAGEGLLLVGLWEEARMTSRMAGGHVNLSQRLAVLMYEPENGSFRELVYDDSILLSIEVVQVAAGESFVAIVVRLPKGGGYEVRVFDIATERQSARLIGKTYQTPVSVAWRGPQEILVLERDRPPEVLQVSR
jgi:hypothetical protein